MTREENVRRLLIDIRQEMLALEFWEDTPPSAQALSSQEPFAVDTLQFTQWLQWIMIPRLDEMLNRELPLPVQCSIAPMASESLSPCPENTQRLEALIDELDQTLTLHH